MALLHDIERHVASKLYLLLGPGQSHGFTLAWPWLGNWGVYRSRSGGAADQEGNVHLWFDASKRPAWAVRCRWRAPGRRRGG